GSIRPRGTTGPGEAGARSGGGAEWSVAPSGLRARDEMMRALGSATAGHARPQHDRAAGEGSPLGELLRGAGPVLVQLDRFEIRCGHVVDLGVGHELPVDPQVRRASSARSRKRGEAHAVSTAPKPDDSHAARIAENIARVSRVALDDVLTRIELSGTK